MVLSEKQLAQQKFEKRRASCLIGMVARQAKMLQKAMPRNAKQASRGPNILLTK